MKPIIGPAWTPEDLENLANYLCVICNEENKQVAYDLLDHGFAITAMTKEQYLWVRKCISRA